MRISVVTPSFNLGPYLEDTIQSVVANLRPGDEYFVIDGGSADGSVDIIRRYERQITSWVSERDEGYGDALAKGFALATGDILCWVNAGDLYLPGAFEAARQWLTSDLDMIFGDDFYIDAANRILSYSRGWVPDLRLATLYGGWSPLQDACFWRRGLYEAVGGIDVGLKYAADFDLFLRMSIAGRTRHVPVTFSAFRRHHGQISVAKAAGYQLERRRLQATHMPTDPVSPATRLFRRIFYRLVLSARARVGPRLWHRPDLRGRLVTSLPCGSYWPKPGRSSPEVS
ncbi:glycosyltransferase family 2 protein [Bradyrhizobium sp. HKCCYLS20291]|uniref:glycosyltransferase family 2 protein n=1 Tax=Bradyrhizobium sp. HKCCYLS20291 TaxID=3420766 RepID=UPI003EC0B705